MNWYNGNIGNAISESKSNKLVFLVYCFDANSNETSELWNSEPVSEMCRLNCVCLKLEADTEVCNQFKQIYAVETYPTTYLIGNNGRALEVISGNVNREELVARLQKAIDAHKESTNSATPAATTSSSATPESTSTDDTSTEATSSNSSSGTSLLSVEERVALAREKVRLLQEKKKAEDEEKEKASEMERRRLGQEVLKAKREKEEMELRRIAEDKRKEKLADELAKQRIKERIQQDREEKQKKYAKEKEETDNAKKAANELLEQTKRQEMQAEAARSSQNARIQFRFVDGSSTVGHFDADQTLSDARAFVAQKLKEMNESQSFSLHSSFPKREYTTSDMSTSLRALQLAPSASLLVIPIKSRTSKALSSFMPISTSASSSAGSSSSASRPSASSSSSSGSSSSLVTYTQDILSLVFLPFTIIWGIVTSLIFGVPGATSSGSSAARSSASQQTQQSANRDQGQSAADLRQRRNRNIGGGGGDDDDNATWNGNSTQQM